MKLNNSRVLVCSAMLCLNLLMGAASPYSVEASSSGAPAAQAASTLPVRWGFYVTYNPNSWTSLQANVTKLNYVSPWFYYVNKEGQVTGNAQAHVNALLKKNGVKSLPMIKNIPEYDDFTAILTDTNKQLSIISSIDLLLTQNNYDGITIDFEGLNGSDKPLLNAFIKRLYDTLHPKGKLVAIAVAVKTRDDQTGWAGAYDYKALEAVTDYILVMGYDFHWANGEPGAVAPLDRVRDTLRYTLTRVPPKKVIWGIGLYGYDWPTGPAPPRPTPSAQAATNTPTPTPSPTLTPTPMATPGEVKKPPKADYRSYAEAQEKARLDGAKAGYDEKAQAPWVRYAENELSREIWYEDVKSFRAKLNLVVERDVAGFALWRLGHEDPKVWAEIAKVGPPWACAPVKAFKSTAEKAYFKETKHSLKGMFLRYWRDNGGLPVFGFPLTEAFDEKSPTDGKLYRVQYFERARMEYHPSKKPPNDVQLGLLGVQALGNRQLQAANDPVSDPSAIYFPAVKRSLGGPFLLYWQQFGDLRRFGYPISDPVLEHSSTDGKLYRVQYLERARMEWHPEHVGTPSEVQLGLLGLNVLPCR